MKQVTLEEWAAAIGRSEDSVRNHWRPDPSFPQPSGSRPTPGPGPGVDLYTLAELEAWRRSWEETRDKPAPAPFTCPGDPNQYLTLGAIARLLGVDGRTVTQYRTYIDGRTTPQQHGARQRYRLGDVIDALNTRSGRGVALSPETDRRRRS